MSWNYRVVKRHGTHHGEVWYGIAEVYTNPDGITQNDVTPFSETREGLKQVLERMLEAFNKPVIEDLDATFTGWMEAI